jgi:hypothetical protein
VIQTHYSLYDLQNKGVEHLIIEMVVRFQVLVAAEYEDDSLLGYFAALFFGR